MGLSGGRLRILAENVHKDDLQKIKAKATLFLYHIFQILLIIIRNKVPFVLSYKISLFIRYVY